MMEGNVGKEKRKEVRDKSRMERGQREKEKTVRKMHRE